MKIIIELSFWERGSIKEIFKKFKINISILQYKKSITWGWNAFHRSTEAAPSIIHVRLASIHQTSFDGFSFISSFVAATPTYFTTTCSSFYSTFFSQRHWMLHNNFQLRWFTRRYWQLLFRLRPANPPLLLLSLRTDPFSSPLRPMLWRPSRRRFYRYAPICRTVSLKFISRCIYVAFQLIIYWIIGFWYGSWASGDSISEAFCGNQEWRSGRVECEGGCKFCSGRSHCVES